MRPLFLPTFVTAITFHGPRPHGHTIGSSAHDGWRGAPPAARAGSVGVVARPHWRGSCSICAPKPRVESCGFLSCAYRESPSLLATAATEPELPVPLQVARLMFSDAVGVMLWRGEPLSIGTLTAAAATRAQFM